MPSPSPTSRRSSSSVGPRNNSGFSHVTDTLVPRASLQQTFLTASSNSAASRALHDLINDHKENSSENSNIRGVSGRSNQNLKASSKKPWVTHFAKPATTLSPSKRVLVDRNSSCSPVRLGPVGSGDEETFSDKRVARAITPRGREDAPTTPAGPVRGVAELSKRIQQFLEDQDVLLGVKTSNSHEVTSACPSVTPADQPGQHPSSSPYNPYKSPFFERPKFLRLNGNASPLEAGPAASVDCTDTLMESTTEELPLFEGDQVLATPLQQIQFSTILSPSSIEDEEVKLAEPAATPLQQIQFSMNLSPASIEHDEVKLAEHAKDQFLEEVAIEEAALDALELKAPPIHLDEVSCPWDLEPKVGNEGEGTTPGVGDESRKLQDKDYCLDGDMAKQVENQKYKVRGTDMQVKDDVVNSNPEEGFQEYHDEVQNHSLKFVETDDVVGTVDGEDVVWGKKAVRITLCGVFLSTFVFLVLLSSAGPGLLPQSLVSNPVNSFWQSSKYHSHSMMLLRGMDGLWNREEKYFPADARIAALRAAEFFHVISEKSNQVRQELQLYFRVACSILDDLRRVLVQKIYILMNHETTGELEDRARQFEWIQDYEFEEEWGDEIPKLDYTDWELLHEYDMGAANQFVLGSIPESLKNDFRRNFSRLSDSPEVQDLLEDLMKLKGGNTEEDRLEVLQYFWEYRMFSASAHESLTKSQFESTVEDDSTIQGFSTLSKQQDVENMGTDHDIKGQNTMESTGQIEDTDFQTPTEEPPFILEYAQLDAHLDELADHLLEEAAIHKEQIFPELSDNASLIQESIIYEHSQTLNGGHLDEPTDHVLAETTTIEKEQVVPKMSEAPSELIQGSMAVWENEAALTNSVHELQIEVDNVETSSTDVRSVQPISDVNPDIAQMVTLATFIVVSFFVLGRNKQPKNVTKIITHASSSSIQFLKKFDNFPNNFDEETQQNRQLFAEMKQGKKDVTMIEELNDRFASVLQSPESNKLHLRGPHARKDEDLVRSPVPTSATSPYGSFTTYKLMAKKEGQAMETKLTPLRRSSRIRNHVTMSPNTNGAKRIAISPP